jgi:hypothetical protein
VPTLPIWAADWKRILRVLVAFACGFPICEATAVTVPPPDPSASCAHAEYAAQRTQVGPQSPSPSEVSTLIVVNGTPRLNTTDEIKMDQQVTVCIMGLHDWIYRQKKDPRTLRLFIGGYLLTKIPPIVSPSAQEYLNFTLQMDTADSADWKAWAGIIDASRHSEDDELPISVGVADTNEIYESNATVRIIPYPEKWPYLLAGFVVLLAALVWLAATSDLLRNAVGQRPSLPQKSPFSLALVQMAFWFYLVLAAYVYICVSTHQVHIPMGSVLGLLGISSTTGLAAVFVDKKKEADSQRERNSLLAEQAALNSRVTDLLSIGITSGSAAEAELAQKKSRLAEVVAAIAQLPPPAGPSVSNNFLRDVLDDGDGISFHRFQIAIWTIVLGVVFVWSVYRNISMPEFDASLLTLMGISSGTYIGFKFPEKPK